jgi:predicted NUDIX family NTP pyrophosphohydrolase
MVQRSAGILMYKRAQKSARGTLRLLLVHPGGPFWARKDLGAWSIPKGEYDETEDPLAVAIREFEEETGLRPAGEFMSLGEVVQPSRKRVTAYAVEGDLDVTTLTSNHFELEWPPRSGRVRSFPEVDRAEWFTVGRARAKILTGQRAFIDRLTALLRVGARVDAEDGDA